jgi:hypothetical protein
MGDCLLWVPSFFKITEAYSHMYYFSPNVLVIYMFILTKKTGWATFWATFSQTHRVTLVVSKVRIW